MAVSAPSLHGALAEIVGREHVVADGAALGAAAIDGVAPRWLVSAASDEQVSRLLALAVAERLAVAPRGGGSSLDLGNPPRRLDVVLDLSRLGALTEYTPDDMVTSVEAGMTLGALGPHLRAHGQRLAIDPPGGETRTIGGVLATHASGPLRFRYGTPRDLLLGVRFVLADGTVTWGGSKVVKSVTGYDVPKLLVGSLGTLGVIVSATLRLHPVPAATGSWLCEFPSSRAAQDFIDLLLASPLEPERLMLVDASARAIARWPGPGPAVAVSIASTDEAVASQGAALARLAQDVAGRARGVPEAAWPAFAGAIAAPVVVKLAGEIRKAGVWLERAHGLAAQAGIELAAIGQAGHGVLWFALRGVRSGAHLSEAMLAPLRAELAGEGGSAMVERAPADLKSDLDVWGPIPPESLAIMARIKAEFDPGGVLNPGRFVGGL